MPFCKMRYRELVTEGGFLIIWDYMQGRGYIPQKILDVEFLRDMSSQVLGDALDLYH
jgi:hypothetical protein